MPATYNGSAVFIGDDSDLRFLDPKGVVVGLYAKGKAKKDTSGFVKSPIIPILLAAWGLGGTTPSVRFLKSLESSGFLIKF